MLFVVIGHYNSQGSLVLTQHPLEQMTLRSDDPSD